MNIQIILTQEEQNLFALRVGIANQQEEQLNVLNQELAHSKTLLDTVWKAIHQRWQLEKHEERASLVFPKDIQLKFENGAIFCDIEDAKEGATE